MKTTLQKILPILLAIILTVIVMRSCNKQETKIEYKPVIVEKIIRWGKQSDSTKQEVKKQDSVRVKYIVKWREKKSDTIYKECEELILICDTIIKTDSSQISGLNHVINLNDSIIKFQKIMLHNDSLDAQCLKKEIKRQKWQKRGIIAAWALREGAAILK